ncbi:hypothetical protein EC991_010468 [Linnemannia zychae]|nr:hypothetical protein EC991_010468 [Linnemannia zychae]
MVETSSIAALLKRLDAVTTKLEDQAMAAASAADVSSSLTGSGGGAGGPRPSHSLSVLPSGNGENSAGVSLGNSPSISGVSTSSNFPVVDGYDELINGPLKLLMEFSRAIGGLVEEQAEHVSKLLVAQREMITIATASHKPPMTSDVFRLLLEPTQQELTQVLEIREKNRSNAYIQHLSTLAEGIRCFGWVSIESKPGTYIGQVKDTAQTHASKVIAEWQEKDENHVHWAHAFIRLLTELQAYVRKYHPAGLVWNPKGTPLDINKLTRTENSTSAAGTDGTPSTSPLPPHAPLAPIPPTQTTATPLRSSLPTRDADMSAVFAQLNQGETITSHLRPVENTSTRSRRPSGAGNARAESKSSISASRSPRMALEGSKWIIEHFENNNDVVLESAELDQSIHIFGCLNSTIQIKTKVTSIAMDSCTKTGLCVESLTTSLNVVNSKSIQLQILGTAPTVSLDKVDSCMVYLSRECMDTTGILTTKCSGVNVLTPVPVPEQAAEGTATVAGAAESSGNNNAFVEQPVPEQLFTRMVDGKMVTSIVEHPSKSSTMKGTFLAPALFLLSLLATTPTAVLAGKYTLSTPTAATRWAPGQPGLVTILSTDKANAKTIPTDRLLTVTLRVSKGGLLGGSTEVAMIQQGFQLMIPFQSTETQVKSEISNWVVPASAPPGEKYFVRVERAKDGFFDIPDKVESPYFQIAAAPVTPPTVPPGTTGPTVPTPTTNTTTPTSTAPAKPTLPPGQTCDDVKAQCAAQNLVYYDSNSTAICQCGAAVISPIIRDNAVAGFSGCQHGLLAISVTAMSVLMSSVLL